jgi:hypothetical protein
LAESTTKISAAIGCGLNARVKHFSPSSPALPLAANKKFSAAIGCGLNAQLKHVSRHPLQLSHWLQA